MKKLMIFCLLCIGFANSHAQDYFRYVDGEKHYFEISPDFKSVSLLNDL